MTELLLPPGLTPPLGCLLGAWPMMVDFGCPRTCNVEDDFQPIIFMLPALSKSQQRRTFQRTNGGDTLQISHPWQ